MERNKLLLTVYKDQFNIHFFKKKNTRPKVRQVLQDKGKRDASPHCTGQGLSLDKTQNT